MATSPPSPEGASTNSVEPSAEPSASNHPAGDQTISAPQPAEYHPAVKARIERCAIDLFGRKGFAATSVREIVEAAGVTKPSLYYYFRGKEHLYESLIVETLQSFHKELVEKTKASGSTRERLLCIAQAHLERVESEPMTVRFMFRALFGFAAQTPQIDFTHYAAETDGLIRQVLEEGAAKGELPHGAASDFAVVQFTGLLHIYIMRNAVGLRDDLSSPLAERVVELFLKGLESCQ